MHDEQKIGEDISEARKRWVSEAEVILGAGKGHMGIINYLRTRGMSADEAKSHSYEIFDEARRRLMQSQLFYRIFGWSMIILGCLLPVVLFFLQSQIIIFLGLPIIGGMILLGKLVNPSRLPKD